MSILRPIILLLSYDPFLPADDGPVLIRSVLDEDHDLFGGTYAGANSLPAVKEEVESADFVLMAGKLESDFK